MIFLRQKYKQKPKQWGSVLSVKSGIRYALARLGIAYSDCILALPFWGKDSVNYGIDITDMTVNGPPVFSKNQWRFTLPAHYIQLNNFAPLMSNAQGAMIVNVEPINNTGSQFLATARTGSDSGRRYIANEAGLLRLGWHTQNPISTTAPFTVGKAELVTLTWPAAESSIGYTAYMGSEVVSENTSVGNTQPDSLMVGGVSNLPGHSNFHADAAYNFFLLFRITLSGSQVAELAENPYQLWQPYRRTVYSLPSQDELLPNNIITDIPMLGNTSITQSHVIGPSGIACDDPVLENMNLSQLHSLVCSNIVTGTLLVGQPGLSEIHTLNIGNTETDNPVISSIIFGQEHVLSFGGIVAGIPILNNPDVVSEAGSDNVIAIDVISGLPIVSVPDLAQFHSIDLSSVVSGIPIIGIPILNQDLPDTPADRIYNIGIETRTYIIVYENRILII